MQYCLAIRSTVVQYPHFVSFENFIVNKCLNNFYHFTNHLNKFSCFLKVKYAQKIEKKNFRFSAQRSQQLTDIGKNQLYKRKRNINDRGPDKPKLQGLYPQHLKFNSS